MSRKTIFTFGGATKGVRSTDDTYDTVKGVEGFNMVGSIHNDQEENELLNDPRLKELYEALLAKGVGRQRVTQSRDPNYDDVEGFEADTSRVSDQNRSFKIGGVTTSASNTDNRADFSDIEYDSDSEYDEAEWDESDAESEELPFHVESADQKASFAKVMNELRSKRESVENQDSSSWAGDSDYESPQIYLSEDGSSESLNTTTSKPNGANGIRRRGAMKRVSVNKGVDTQSDSGNGSGSSSSDSDKDNISVSSQDSDSQSNPTPPIAKARSEASLQQNQGNSVNPFAPTPLPRQEKARPIAVPRVRSRQVESSDFGDFTFWGDKNPKPKEGAYLNPAQGSSQENGNPIYEEIKYSDMDGPDFVGQGQKTPPVLPKRYDPNTVNEMIQDQMHRMDVNDRGEAEDIFGDPLALASEKNMTEKPIPVPRNQEQIAQRERLNLSLESLAMLAKEMRFGRKSPDNIPVAAQRSATSLGQGGPQSQSGSQKSLASFRDSGNESSLFEDKTQSPTPQPRPNSSLGVASGGVERGI